MYVTRAVGCQGRRPNWNFGRPAPDLLLSDRPVRRSCDRPLLLRL